MCLFQQHLYAIGRSLKKEQLVLYATTGLGVSCIDCAAAFHEECRPRVCPYIEKVPFFKLMNHPTMAQAFTVGSMGPI